MSDRNRIYLELASIVGNENWRNDEELLKAFTLWTHTHFGLAWQTVMFSTQASLSHIGSPIQSANLVFVNNVLSRIEIETVGEKYKVSSTDMKLPALVRVLFLAPRVQVSGVESAELDRLLKLQLKSGQLSEGSGLYKKLMNDFSASKRGKSRSSRLVAKFLKDPVLFFRDSKGVFGRSVYSLLHLVGKEKAL